MKKVYRLSSVRVVAGFERIDVDESGGEEVKTNQIITYNKLMTADQFLALMQTKVEPGQDITCEILPDLLA